MVHAAHCESRTLCYLFADGAFLEDMLSSKRLGDYSCGWMWNRDTSAANITHGNIKYSYSLIWLERYGIFGDKVISRQWNMISVWNREPDAGVLEDGARHICREVEYLAL